MEASDVVDDLRRLVESGVSLRAAGRELGVSATTVYRRLLPYGDQVQRRRRRPVLQSDRRRILAIAADGEVSIRRIAATVGRSWHVVRRVVGDDTLRLAAPRRCPKCGYRINVQPCQICHARASQTVTIATKAHPSERGQAVVRSPLAPHR